MAARPAALQPRVVLWMAGTLACAPLLLFCACTDSSSGPPDTQSPPDDQPSQISIVSGNGQGALLGQPVAESLSVKVTASGGAAVQNAGVTWTVTAGGGTVNPASSPTDAGGIAKTLWTLGSAAVEQRVRAAVQGVSQSAEFSANAVDLRPVDTHTHLQPGPGGLPAAAAVFAGTLPSRNLQWFVFMTPPLPSGHPAKYDVAQLAVALQPNTDRVAFLGGGGSLNGMIHEAAETGSVSAELRASFDSTAAALLAQGARGFGEIAAMHLSLFSGHPYESVAADHELLRRLADVAAERGVPVDLHLDVVTADQPLPPTLARPPNPATLTENLAAFERLLEHNRGANIVWDHAGTDFTGQRTVALMRQVLQRHSNLYISLTLGRHPPPTQPNSPLDTDGRLRPEWISLIEDFSDRFVLGSDHFYQDPGAPRPFLATLDPTLAILTQLPVDVAIRVGAENAKALFGLE